jgi:hypothetical protein
MENGNDQDDNPKNKNKKSHKRGKPTIKNLVKAKRVEEKAQKAAPKSRNRLPKYSNLQQSNAKRQKNQGITVDERNNLGFASTDFLTPTKKATDVNKISRANFAEREKKTEKKKASETKRRASRDDLPSRKKEKLENAPPEAVLGINTRRLALEDFVMLEPLTAVYILVSEDHTTYQETFSKLEAKSTIGLDLDDPSTSMHCYEAVVSKNPQRVGLSSGTWNREEIKNLLTPKGGAAVAFEFPSTRAIGIELKWAEFFDNLNTLHVWAALPNHRNYREVLKPKRKNKEALTQLYNRLCKEAYGDKYTLALIQNAYSTIVAT